MQMSNDSNKKINTIENTSLALLRAIFEYKKSSNNDSVYTIIKKYFIIFLFSLLITTIFNYLDIKISYIHDFLQDLLNILGILIGFTLTALSIVGTGLFERALDFFLENKSTSNKKYSVYQVILFEFLDYLYSLLATLFFVISMLFLYPFAYFLNEYRFIISLVFFYILFCLLKWNIFSIKSLVYNLYGIFMLNAQANNVSKKN